MIKLLRLIGVLSTAWVSVRALGGTQGDLCGALAVARCLLRMGGYWMDRKRNIHTLIHRCNIQNQHQ